ncbi:hypothetical protein EVAR_39487_1 [Eumeta japonica]|uniref:Uncharacterized protein n=1 Tax=Eumeta variegata TaxID=151549 RepID=A0A4C1VZK8_EUMVA|nr:hypothetical protein EVAR_39487_1 [Eumeta japonica]
MKESEQISDGASSPAAGAAEATPVGDVRSRLYINAGLHGHRDDRALAAVVLERDASDIRIRDAGGRSGERTKKLVILTQSICSRRPPPATRRECLSTRVHTRGGWPAPGHLAGKYASSGRLLILKSPGVFKVGSSPAGGGRREARATHRFHNKPNNAIAG